MNIISTSTMFRLIQSNIKNNPFEELRKTKFEYITNGRSGAILVEPLGKKIPIVRTTTIYKNAPIKFNDLHRTIINELELKFNNALIEIYDIRYKTMGFHTDQSLDLADESYIAIYSCYKNSATPNRKVIVMNKETNEITEIILDHNSILLFSIETNGKHVHKIILDDKVDNSNEWIGITYRLSKTYVDPDNIDIGLANEIEKKEFYKQKNLENTTINYKYKPITYTISPSDLLQPID